MVQPNLSPLIAIIVMSQTAIITQIKGQTNGPTQGYCIMSGTQCIVRLQAVVNM